MPNGVVNYATSRLRLPLIAASIVSNSVTSATTSLLEMAFGSCESTLVQAIACTTASLAPKLFCSCAAETNGRSPQTLFVLRTTGRTGRRKVKYGKAPKRPFP